jgi:hypothetical protein
MVFVATPDRNKPAPRGLGTRGKTLWHEIFQTYELNPSEIEIAHEMARCVDEIDAMTRQLRTEKLTVKGSRNQPVPHPLLAEVRAHRELLRRLARQLGLPDPVSAPAPKVVRKGRVAGVTTLQQRRRSI